MNNNQSSLICLAGGWGLAFLASLLAFVILLIVGDWRLIQAIFAAIIVFVIVGALVSWIACKPLPAPGEQSFKPKADTHPVPSSAQSAADAAAKAKAGAVVDSPAPATASAAAASPAAAVAAAKAGLKPSAPLAGEAELASRKGTWRYEGGDATAPAAAKAPAAEAPEAEAPAPKTKAEAVAAAAAKPDAANKDDVDYDNDGIIEGKDEGSRPEALSEARGGKADNLKEIKGIGPKLEILCNTLGFYHFDQIAAWTSDEVAWVDANLEGFKGRVSRDEWVKQAKILASGGETEFSKRVDDGDVY